MVCIICRDLVFWTHDPSFLTPAIQVAKLSGYSPIITTASARNAEYVKSLGATHVLDRNTVPISALGDAVKKITSEPITIAFDSISEAETQNAAYEVLSDENNRNVRSAHPQP